AVLFHGGLWRLHIEEERALGLAGVEPFFKKQLHERVHAARIFRRDFLSDFGMIETVGGGVLNREKLAGVGVVLDVGVGFDEQFVADDEAAAPAGHVERLARGVEFDANFLRAGYREKTERRAFKYERGVGGVVNHHEFVVSRELNHLAEKRGR